MKDAQEKKASRCMFRDYESSETGQIMMEGINCELEGASKHV
jgi:hypothetical protein